MNKHKFFKIIGKCLPMFGIIIFIYIIYDIGIERIYLTFSIIPFYLYLLGFVLFVPRTGLLSLKWLYICKKQKMDFSLIYLLKVYLLGLFYSSITPQGLGWHIRIYHIKKKGYPWEKSIANSLLDDHISGIAALSLALIGSTIFIREIPWIFFIIALFLLIDILILIVFIKKQTGTKILNFFKFLVPKKYKEGYLKSAELLYQDLPKLQDTFIPLLIEIVGLFIASTQVFIISLAFSLEIPYLNFVLIVIISIVLGNALPISIGGLGVREGVFVYLLSTKYGVLPETAFVISLTGYLVKTIFPGLIGWFISLKNQE